MTNAEIPANKITTGSARLERTGLDCISTSRRPPWRARTISKMPKIKRIEAKIYFHIAIEFYYKAPMPSPIGGEGGVNEFSS